MGFVAIATAFTATSKSTLAVAAFASTNFAPSAASSAQLPPLTLLDWALLAVVAVSTLGGLLRGLLRSACSLIGLFAGLVLAAWNYKALAQSLLHFLGGHFLQDKGLAEVIAFLLIAVGVMLLAGLVGSLLRKTAKTVGLGWLDSLLGGVFGFLRGCLLAGASMMALAALLPASSLATESTFAPYCLGAARQMAVLAPSNLRQRIAAAASRIEAAARVRQQQLERN